MSLGVLEPFFNGTVFSTILKKKTKQYDVDGSKIVRLLLPKLKEQGFKIKDSTPTSLVIDTSSSFWSFGEEMVISVDNDNKGCKVTISSDPKYQLIDWGKSGENIDNIFSIIDKIVRD